MEGVIGYTTMFAGNFEPKNWAFCQGQIVTIASNTALYSILGTSYGGNGTTTFGLPDLRGRYIVGVGTGAGLSPYALGQKGGSETVTLSTLQMPAHVHPIQVTTNQNCLEDTGNSSSPENTIYAANGSGYSGTGGAHMKPFQLNVQMTPAGSDAPYEILPAYMAVNYIICLRGVYPARN